MKRISRRTLLGTAAACALSAPAVRAQKADMGVALVIGNSKYRREATLPNVRRDAMEIARRFRGMGLATDLVEDADHDAMLRAIEKLGAAARGANLAAFYFAGHGAHLDNRTYFVPADADLGDPAVLRSLVDTNRVRGGLAPAQHRLLAFDCGRNHPADGWQQKEASDRAGWREDVPEFPLPNSLVLFSTAPGRIALDGPPGGNSPFAVSLMRQLDAPSIDLQTLASALRRDLLVTTEGRQLLFDRNSYKQSFVIRGSGLAPAAGPAGWAGDPSRLVELPNAYAFARQNGLPLPEGLVAHRDSASGKDARMIGSYRTVDPRGNVMLLVVLSAGEQPGAEVVGAGRANPANRSGWRFMRGTSTGSSLDIQPTSQSGTLHMSWNDANSGRVILLGARGFGGKASHNAPFTRLDG